jgi:hypothetical protein
MLKLFHATYRRGCIDSRSVYLMAVMRIRALIKALGGPSVVAAKCGLGMAAVSNWSARDAIAHEHRIVVWRLARAKGIDWRPPGAEELELPPTAPPPPPKSRSKRATPESTPPSRTPRQAAE